MTSPSRSSEIGTTVVSSPSTRSAVSGSNSARAVRAPRAWAIERISSQCPRSMIVMRVASSHQTSTSNRPRVPAQLVAKATTMAIEMRVIIPGWRSRSSPAAPRRKTRPPYTNTIVPRTAGSELEQRAHRQHVAEPVGDVVAQQDDRDRQEQAQPELVPEHRDRMTGVLVVTRRACRGRQACRDRQACRGRVAATPSWRARPGALRGPCRSSFCGVRGRCREVWIYSLGVSYDTDASPPPNAVNRCPPSGRP